MTSDELDDLILAHLAGELEGADRARLDRALAGNPDSGRRLAELALQESLLSEIGDGRIAEPAQSAGAGWRWVGFAAAALIVALLLVAALREEAAPERVVTAPPAPAPKAPPREIVRETPPAPAPSPPKETPRPLIVDAPKKEDPPLPAPPPKPEPPPVVQKPESKEEPKPLLTPEAPKSVPDPVLYKPVTVATIHGALWRRREGKTEAVQPAMELSRADQILTSHRRPASFGTAAGFTVWLEKNSSVGVELRADGGTRVTVPSGTAFFTVLPRTTPFVVATPEGEAVVLGTSFQVERDEKRMLVAVLEGSVRLRNDKGDVLIKAGQRSGVRAGERPTAPVKADVEAIAAWRLRPELSDNPDRLPFADHEAGGNRRLAGLAIAAPYAEGEEDSGRLARAVAERLDVGLALGHHYRDLEKKRWINVDRGMEAELLADGSRAPEAFSDRARKATAEYLDRVRAAAGVAAREPVPMIVQMRTHYEDLEAGEVAAIGWNRATMAAAKAAYAQLLEKHKPALRLELRFQGVDKVLHAEDDARVEGYMAQRHARNAVAFFVPSSFGKRPENIDVYGRILGELVEFLFLRRR